ncbi:hypothetical protein [Chelativorans sp.]|uniref:hypothetical protein n=1 Tax=Chelativorans sp. TaxID=2203393 RepID=UPI002810F4C2|nr:hypothetical protein [Chelativorans sp.]
MRSGFRQIEQSFASFTNETRASINALSATIAERSKPQWQAIGVALTFAVIIGGMAYWPIREATTDLKTDVSTLSAETRRAFDMAAERFVTREELDWRAARSAEDRSRTDTAIEDLRTTMLPRNGWSERNLNRDHEIANLQRQIDLQREDFQQFSSSLGNGRDVIQDLKSEIERLRDQLADVRTRQFQRMGASP